MLPDPPPGWIALQERAKRATTPADLAVAIDEMHRLLAEYEKTAGDGESKSRRRPGSRKSTRKDDR